MTPRTLRDVLLTRRDDLIRRWRARIEGAITPRTTEPEIVDTLPQFIDELAAALDAGARSSLDEVDSIGAKHGTQRFHGGFSLGAVVREYGVFRECLFDVIRESGATATLDELGVFTRLVNAAIASAVEEYTRERDAVIQRQSDEHFAFVAHEIRNPLATATMAAESVGRHLVEPQKGAFERLRRSLGRLSSVVDHALVQVRLRSLGRAPELHVESLDLVELARSAVSETQGDADDKQLRVRVESAGAVPVFGDRRLLDSAVHNLLRNALKFTQRGGKVTLRLRSGEGVASLEVADECGGLPAGSAGELFTPFVQKGMDRQGFGLGLAIVKQAVEAHAGTVQVVDVPGTGCIFMLSVPERRDR